jgi:hypothetical protein
MTDRFKGGLAAFISRITRKYDYAFPWSYTVSSQNSDGTLELTPEQPSKVPGLSNIPCKWGNAGVTAKVNKGARCLVMFAGGDPGKPFVLGWEHGSFESISLGDDGLPAARQGDTVECGGPGTVVTLMPTLPIPVVTPVGPGSIVPMTPIVALISFSMVPPTPATADPLVGVISIGSDKTTIE